jgi:glycerol-3-phosphate dehydrogenase
LGGNTRERIDELLASAAAIAVRHALSPEEVTHIIRDYGVQAPNVLAVLPENAAPGLTRLECAQIAFGVEHEMDQNLADMMFVSTYWGYERQWTRENLLPFAREMGRLLRWDDRRREAETAAFPSH